MKKLSGIFANFISATSLLTVLFTFSSAGNVQARIECLKAYIDESNNIGLGFDPGAIGGILGFPAAIAVNALFVVTNPLASTVVIVGGAAIDMTLRKIRFNHLNTIINLIDEAYSIIPDDQPDRLEYTHALTKRLSRKHNTEYTISQVRAAIREMDQKEGTCEFDSSVKLKANLQEVLSKRKFIQGVSEILEAQLAQDRLDDVEILGDVEIRTELELELGIEL